MDQSINPQATYGLTDAGRGGFELAARGFFDGEGPEDQGGSRREESEIPDHDRCLTTRDRRGDRTGATKYCEKLHDPPIHFLKCRQINYM